MRRSIFVICTLIMGITLADRSPAPQMRAYRMLDFGGPEVMRLESVPIPEPGPGYVRIRIHAASVNPIDWKIRSGSLKERYPVTPPYIPGRDVAGIIDALGAGVDQWKVGDAVMAILELQPPGGGAFSEYVLVSATDIALKPASLSFEVAAGVPLVSLTAWRAVIEAANVQAGQRVLVHGGAGGVGSLAVQLAHWRGAHVIATASARNHEYLKSIGAAEMLDYRTTRFEDALSDVDVVIDTVGGDTLERSPVVLRQGGKLVSVVGVLAPARCAQLNIHCPDLYGHQATAGERLARIGPLFDSGDLGLHVDAVYPLEALNDALAHNETGHTRGKVIVRVLQDN